MNKLTAEKCRAMINSMKMIALSEMDEHHLQALEIALPILEQQERGEGWIEWKGGSRPVPLWQSLEVRLRSGNFRSGQTAAYWVWQHTGGINDIIAYRIIPERATNQNGEQ